jgi:hypothetical protein
VILIANSTSAQHIVSSALLAIDQNRTTVVDRIVGEWGATLSRSSAGISSAQLHTLLMGLRADHLLAASLAGSPTGLRDVLANSLSSTTAAKSPRLQPQALGDTSDDLVYTPVSPCRLFDTRPAQGGIGVMTPNVRRTYGATTPVANQGGPGGCNAAAGAAVALIQIGTLTPSGNGYLQGGAQGVASFPNALILYQPGDQYGTAVAMPLNIANGRFDVQVQFAATDLYGDLLGYFQRPKNYGGTHVITGIAATDSGGFNNTASGGESTVGGGFGNTASGDYSTVGGGSSNTASGGSSTVAGGFGNIASGYFSTVAGGYGNTAFGYSSFAAGNKANANYDGCFVWGDDSTSNEVRCDEQNRFVVRATHGIFMFTGGTTQASYTGAVLPPGATAWIAGSDRAGKDNLQPVDAKAVLRKVATMPIATWNWKSQDASIRHMGPMAQDFHAAFGLGEMPTGISTVDADGVALAAIQGLHQMVKQRDKEIATLKRKLQAIEAKLGL